MSLTPYLSLNKDWHIKRCRHVYSSFAGPANHGGGMVRCPLVRFIPARLTRGIVARNLGVRVLRLPPVHVPEPMSGEMQVPVVVPCSIEKILVMGMIEVRVESAWVGRSTKWFRRKCTTGVVGLHVSLCSSGAITFLMSVKI